MSLASPPLVAAGPPAYEIFGDRSPGRRSSGSGWPATHANGGELPIPAVATHVGLGERQLERLFDERVGYGPKTFARVVRLQRATASIARGSIASWARLALSCGYSDQAHLVREFRALTGVTPRVYASARAVSEIDNPARDLLASVDA